MFQIKSWLYVRSSERRIKFHFVGKNNKTMWNKCDTARIYLQTSSLGCISACDSLLMTSLWSILRDRKRDSPQRRRKYETTRCCFLFGDFNQKTDYERITNTNSRRIRRNSWWIMRAKRGRSLIAGGFIMVIHVGLLSGSSCIVQLILSTKYFQFPFFLTFEKCKILHIARRIFSESMRLYLT